MTSLGVWPRKWGSVRWEDQLKCFPQNPWTPPKHIGSPHLITDTIPERIAVMCDSRISMFVPVTFDFFHKLGVFFPFFIEDFKDCDAIPVSTDKATTVRSGTFFSPQGGTG